MSLHRVRLSYDPTALVGDNWKREWRVVSSRPASEVSSVPVKTETKRIGQPRLVLLSVCEPALGPANPRSMLDGYLASLEPEEKLRRIPMLLLAAEVRAL